ncbi:hypothetical protein ACFFGH_26060 [Lysobacter korlensis]|uniref:Uncharacterized protein n=1 Tax=Lysobacter korlensis TaxID=553636 RepID=A0ABV6RWF5_9GAMM
MIDAVFREVVLPSHIDEWETVLRKEFLLLRGMPKKHAWANGVMDSAATSG